MLSADLIVSLAKMKTHHWAGATLSMKNFFGLVPGSIYGWPKNELHYIGIDTAIVELTRASSGPRVSRWWTASWAWKATARYKGLRKQAGVLVMGSDLAAVDATCCRIMGIDPARVGYLQKAADRLGVIEESRIEQRGEAIAGLRTNFELIKEFSQLRWRRNSHVCEFAARSVIILGGDAGCYSERHAQTCPGR